jgi:hypothetical protein
MRALFFLAFVAANVSVAAAGHAGGPNSPIILAQSSKHPECVQVISCGTKDGERKEYPTPCDAKDDGATDITPKTGATCEQKK